jgi:hypothetical protein
MIKILDMTDTNFDRLYRLFDHFKGAPEYQGKGGRRFFIKALLSSILIIELDYGIIRVTDYCVGSHIAVHGLFHSKRVFGSVRELHSVGELLFSMFGITEIQITVPSSGRALKRLLTSLDFSVKHDLKNGLHDGSTWVDGTVYRLRRTGGKDNE